MKTSGVGVNAISPEVPFSRRQAKTMRATDHPSLTCADTAPTHPQGEYPQA